MNVAQDQATVVFKCIKSIEGDIRKIEYTDCEDYAKEISIEYGVATLFDMNESLRVCNDVYDFVHTADGLAEWFEGEDGSMGYVLI